MTPATPTLARPQSPADARGLFGLADAMSGHAFVARLLGSHLLLRGQVVSVAGGEEPLRVRCLTGELWISREGDTADHVLEEGQAWRSSGPGQVVVEALSPSAQFLVD